MPSFWPTSAPTEWFVAGAIDGFNLTPDVEPSGIEALVERVLPILRRRGLFRREYKGTTLPDLLRLPGPGDWARRVGKCKA
jgi:hypothetical protein